MKRLPLQLSKITGLEYLTNQDLSDIERIASALSLGDCFDYLMISTEDIPAEELAIATLVHKRGRTLGINSAVEKLFTHMNSRAGGPSALAYLSKMSGDFSVEVTAKSAGSGFSFNVVLPDGEDSK